jgi:hypothetical protein
MGETYVHAVVVTAQIEPGREAEGVENLETNVLPQVRQLPGIVALLVVR